MNDKLLRWIYLLGIRKHAADKSIIVASFLPPPHSVCLLLVSPPTASTRCLEFTRSWSLGEVRVIHKWMTNRPTWNPAPPTGFHQLCRFSANVKETEMLLVKTRARPHRARDMCGGRVLFSFSAKINVICEMLEGVTCQQGNGTDSG